MSKIFTFILLILSTHSAIAGLSDANFEKAKECLGKAESNNNYSAVNSLGYLGRYQFGAQALEDIGYLNNGCYSKYRNNIPDKCWKDGSTAEFLSNKLKQDSALHMLFSINNKRLISNGTLNIKSTQVEILQALFVSHLLGVSSAKKYIKNNIDNNDAYGTTASKYFNIAKDCLE